jgi:hypothetical protein
VKFSTSASARVRDHAPHLRFEHVRPGAADLLGRSSSSSSGMLDQRKNDSREASSKSSIGCVEPGGTSGFSLRPEQEERADQKTRVSAA